ncbi:MAG: hypothetical protein ACREP2_09175 [Rhodanobacteraceae bacterium]
MNATAWTKVQRLVVKLDDTRVFYATLKPLLIRPHLKFLIDRTIDSHEAIAEELVRQIDAAGGRRLRRGGGALATVRATIERWIANSNVDIEFACVKRIAHHESHVAKRFREALDVARARPHDLHRELCQLERTLFRMESLIREMEMPPLAASRQPATIIHFSGHQRSRR